MKNISFLCLTPDVTPQEIENFIKIHQGKIFFVGAPGDLHLGCIYKFYKLYFIKYLLIRNDWAYIGRPSEVGGNWTANL